LFLAIGVEILNDGSFLKKGNSAASFSYELKLLKTMAPVVLAKLVREAARYIGDRMFAHFMVTTKEF
jgi:hypothetical protein